MVMPSQPLFVAADETIPAAGGGRCGATIRIALARQSEWDRATVVFNHWVHHNFDCSPGILARKPWPFGPPPLAASGLTGQDTERPVQP